MRTSFLNFARPTESCGLNVQPKEKSSFMAPEGGSSGRANSKLNQLFENWAERDATGQVFSSSAGFILPDESMRSPNGAWVRNERLEKVTDEQWQKFLPICPDFVLELRSPSDSIRVLWVNG